MGRHTGLTAFLPSTILYRKHVKRCAVRKCSFQNGPQNDGSGTGNARYALRLPLPAGLPNLCVSIAPAVGYAIYLPYILFFSTAHQCDPSQAPLQEAALLSLNFNYLLPLALPSWAATLNPVLEAIFNATVAYAALFIGFATDGPGHLARRRGSDKPRTQDPSTTAFVPDTTLAILLVPFLTNITWLPYLALRNNNVPPLSARDDRQRALPPAWILGVSQSRALPAYALAIFIASIFYGLFAHATPDLPAEIPVRLHEMQRLCLENILSSSFAADWVAFAAFQGWLVDDDVLLRDWTGARAQRAAFAARFIPFFGLVWYLFERANDRSAVRIESE